MKLNGQANRNTKLREQKPKGNLPLLQFAVNEILSLVGRGVCRKCQEVADVFERQALQKLVCNCKSLPCASGTDAKNLEGQPAVPAEGNASSCPSQGFKRSERREGLLFSLRKEVQGNISLSMEEIQQERYETQWKETGNEGQYWAIILGGSRSRNWCICQGV